MFKLNEHYDDNYFYIRYEIPFLMLSIKKKLEINIYPDSIISKFGEDSFSNRITNITSFTYEELKNIHEIALTIDSEWFNDDDIPMYEFDVGDMYISPTPYVVIYIPIIKGNMKICITAKNLAKKYNLEG